MTCVGPHPAGAWLRLRVQPGARRDAIVGLHGDALKVAVAAAPERGRASAAVLALLAEALALRPADVRLLSGSTSRDKRVLLAGLSPFAVATRLGLLLPGRADVAAPSPPASAVRNRRSGRREGS